MIHASTHCAFVPFLKKNKNPENRSPTWTGRIKKSTRGIELKLHQSTQNDELSSFSILSALLHVYTVLRKKSWNWIFLKRFFWDWGNPTLETKKMDGAFLYAGQKCRFWRSMESKLAPPDLLRWCSWVCVLEVSGAAFDFWMIWPMKVDFKVMRTYAKKTPDMGATVYRLTNPT